MDSVFARRRPKLSMDLQSHLLGSSGACGLTDEVRARFDAEYEVLEILGHGSSSLVKRGKLRASDKEVALKIVRSSDPEHQQMARNEFDLIRHLDHPNITKVHDFFALQDATILVVELFTASSLQAVVRAAPNHQLEESTSKVLFTQLLAALDFLHSHRVIHRDVKPQNLLVTKDLSVIKLIDFNVSRRLEEGGSLTMTGTAQYAAPEVLLGQSASDGVDVWAAGLCLHYMLTGALPFRIEDFANRDAFGKYVTEHPVCLEKGQWTDISNPCKYLLRQCLAVTPSLRPAPMTLLESEWITPDSKRQHPKGMFETERTFGQKGYATGICELFDTAPL
eukprot:TRINITY_DN56231_c0_g1_i1.p1 TRINITY_DN56231_c0_g1~~TRINITY_DN56231_c0_g1_i1.p1  ORF type:complete len:336 (+),score=48.97 TRINITY_DN56231_c0_g1_i1:77-1084(+)